MDRTIYLLRHTRTAAKEGVCYGQSDVELAENFELEFANIQHKLKDINFDLVYSSPLTRCKKLASHLSHKILTDDRLMEMNFGEWEYMTWDHIFSLPEGKDWFSDYLNRRCPKGEAFSDLMDRVDQFLLELKNIEGNILIVTHAGVIRAIATHFGITTKESAFNLQVGFGEIIKIENNENQSFSF